MKRRLLAAAIAIVSVPAIASANAILVRNDLPDSRILVEAFRQQDEWRLVPCGSLTIEAASEQHLIAAPDPRCDLAWTLSFKFRTLDPSDGRYGPTGAVCTLEGIGWDSRIAVGPSTARFQILCYK